MNSFYDGDPLSNGTGGGERVRVAMRVRPLMGHELNRADENICSVPD
jgi:hypothetical protein